VRVRIESSFHTVILSMKCSLSVRSGKAFLVTRGTRPEQLYNFCDIRVLMSTPDHEIFTSESSRFCYLKVSFDGSSGTGYKRLNLWEFISHFNLQGSCASSSSARLARTSTAARCCTPRCTRFRFKRLGENLIIYMNYVFPKIELKFQMKSWRGVVDVE